MISIHDEMTLGIAEPGKEERVDPILCWSFAVPVISEPSVSHRYNKKYEVNIMFCWKDYRNQKLRPKQSYIVLVRNRRDNARYITVAITTADGRFPPCGHSDYEIVQYDCHSPQLRCPEEFLWGISWGLKRARSLVNAAVKQVYNTEKK